MRRLGFCVKTRVFEGQEAPESPKVEELASGLGVHSEAVSDEMSRT